MEHLIKELGYIGLEVSDIPAWREFAGSVLGLGVAEGPRPNTVKLRMDEHDYRFLLLEGPADDISFAGWRVEDEAALEAYAGKLRDLNIDYAKASEDECDMRGIDAALIVTDPQGLRHEIYVGETKSDEPFNSKLVANGFVAGEEGLGHIVFGSRSYEKSVSYAKDLLGARLSDTIVQEFAPGMRVNVTFLHVNERHHSIAYADMAGGKRLHHFMIEVGAVEDVGSARDRHLVAGLAVAQDIGQHPNDRMISYYGATPSGFLVEYGFGGRKVDDEVWQARQYTKMSEWGHRPFGTMPNGAKTPAATAAPPAAAKAASPAEKDNIMSVDGNWVLTLSTPMGPQRAKLDLKTEGSAITGVLASPGGDVAVQEGKLEGDTLSWKSDMTVPFPMTLTFSLAVAGESLTGTASGMMGSMNVTGARA